MITADGSIKVVSALQNEDLFWAIRGGGCNFGVVTQFVYKLHAQRKTVYCGTLVFPSNALEALIRVTDQWWTNGPNEKEGMMLILTRGLRKVCTSVGGRLKILVDLDVRNIQPCIVVTLFYNGTEAEGRTAYKAFFGLGPYFFKNITIVFIFSTIFIIHIRSYRRQDQGSPIRGAQRHRCTPLFIVMGSLLTN